MSMLKKCFFYVMVLMMFLLSSPSKVEAATVGDRLTSPEIGWKRFDDKDPHFIYNGAWTIFNNSDHYNKSKHDSKALASVKFKFYGTKLRIISDKNYDHSNNISIKIDGNEHSYSTLNEDHPQIVHPTQTVVYEDKNLDLGFHTVVISNLKAGYFMSLDAVDIDEIGYLIDYNSLSLTASAGNSLVDLKWNLVEGATSYSVARSTTAGGPYTPIASDLTETSYTDKSVVANTTYYYIVKAKVSNTETVTSAEVSATPTTETPTIESKLKVVLEPTESLQLSLDDNLAINTNMIWTSSDNTVATVNEKGVVTALAPGNTVITVKSPDNTYTDYINVLVVEDAGDYRLAIDLKVGQSARLTVDDLTNTVNTTWEPMDSAIANVTSKGKVTALKKGLVLFTAKNEEGNVIGKVYVRVRE